MTGWNLIETAPRDGSLVLVYVDMATVPLVRLAWWDEEDELDFGVGWWSQTSSCGSEKLWWEPTHWKVWEGPEG